MTESTRATYEQTAANLRRNLCDYFGVTNDEGVGVLYRADLNQWRVVLQSGWLEVASPWGTTIECVDWVKEVSPSVKAVRK